MRLALAELRAARKRACYYQKAFFKKTTKKLESRLMRFFRENTNRDTV